MPSHGHMSCWNCWARYSLGQYWKNGCCRGFRLCRAWWKLKKVMPSTAASSFNTHSTDRVKPERWTAVSLYFDELLIQKCQFRGDFKVSILCLDKHSPKGSCHLDESSMNHTLAQNGHCEFWCEMHRTCKNTPIKSDTKNEKYKTIYIYRNNHSRHWPYKTTAIRYMSPPAAAYMRPGAGLYIRMYIYINNMKVQVHASMNLSTTSSVASLGNIGRWAVAPLQYIEVLHLFRWYTHTSSNKNIVESH